MSQRESPMAAHMFGHCRSSPYILRMTTLGLVFTLVLAFVACDGTGGDSPTTLPTRTITVHSADGGISEKMTVELATTRRQREQGLMYRQSLAEDRGMLFLFRGEVSGGFWMKNTYVPLTIAYLDTSGRVVALRDGKPLDTTVLYPDTLFHAVLEVNQGWFERHGMGLGAIVDLPADAPEPE